MVARHVVPVGYPGIRIVPVVMGIPQLLDPAAVLPALILTIGNLEKSFGIEVERDKFDTVGGLIYYLLGRIPRTGDEVETSGICLTVLSAGERRIGKLSAARVTETEREQVQV